MIKEPKILFNDKAAGFILEALGYNVNSKGFIYKCSSGAYAETKNGEHIKLKEFGGVYKEDNKTYFVKSDLYSIIEFAKEIG